MSDAGDGGFVIDTPEGLEHYRMLGHLHALNLEINTGMKHSRGSVLASAQQNYGVQSRTKKGALNELRALYERQYGRQWQSPQEKRAQQGEQ